MSLVINAETAVASIAGDIDEAHWLTWAEVLKEFAQLEQATVTVFYTSSGGDVELALGIYDRIKLFSKTCDKRVEIVANGTIASAATLILQAADVRMATEHTQWLIHAGESTAQSAQEKRHNERLDDTYNRIFANRTGLSLRRIKTLHSGESYLTTQEALKLNLIDGVLK